MKIKKKTTDNIELKEEVTLACALDFDLFEGDFGTSEDIELSNKIVKSRGGYSCHICYGEIEKGEIHRSTTWKFDGELMSYRCCHACCIAMVGSVKGDYEEDDPIEARYLLGHERREQGRMIEGGQVDG